MENGAQACQTGVTVLVVDDETMVRWAAADIFAELGFEVLEASDGVEALAILRERADVDLLFSDCRMPRMGGPELAAAAAALRPKLRIVLTTGYWGAPQGLCAKPRFAERRENTVAFCAARPASGHDGPPPPQSSSVAQPW